MMLFNQFIYTTLALSQHIIVFLDVMLVRF